MVGSKCRKQALEWTMNQSLQSLQGSARRRVVVSFDDRSALWSFVIPAEAGIHKEIDEKILETWIPASAGMTNCQGQPSNDTSARRRAAEGGEIGILAAWPTLKGLLRRR